MPADEQCVEAGKINTLFFRFASRKIFTTIMRNQRIFFSIAAFWCIFVFPVGAQDFFGPSIQEVKLEMPGAKWEFRLDSLKKANPEARMIGTVYVNGMRFDSAGVRYKGNSSYFRTRKDAEKKLPFNIKLDFKKKNQKLGGIHSTVRLSNAFLDPGFIRDPLSYDIVRRFMPASQCNFAKLYINNQYYGLYVNTESVDLNFVKKHFGTTKGHLVKCDPDQWERTRSQNGCPKGENASLSYLNDNAGCYDAFYEVDDAAAWTPLLTLIKTLNKNPEKIESVLDVDQTLWMLALNNAMVNLDSYTGSLAHNYFMWFDSVNVGHPIMWDFNMSFGGWRRNFSFEEMKDQDLIEYSPLAEMDNAKRPLISRLLKNPLYRKIYLAHLRTIVNEVFKSGQWLTRAQAFSRDIDTWVRQDTMKLYTYQDFQNAYDQTMVAGPDKIIGLRQLIDARTVYLDKHPLLNKPEPKLSDVKYAKEGDKVKVTAKTQNAKGAYLYYRTDKRWAFTKIAMADDGANGDAAAGDGIFTGMVEAAKAKQYYVVAESEEAAICFPAKASFEFLKIE